MLQLCISPKTACAPDEQLSHSAEVLAERACVCRYRHTSYHKQTKNQWARDDPAYVIICCCLVALAGTSYCVT